MIFSAKDRLRGISLRVGQMRADGESRYFRKCGDCPYETCVQGVIADEYSRTCRYRYDILAEGAVDKELCSLAAREYLGELTDDQFENLMRAQTLKDTSQLYIAGIIKDFAHTGVVILE